MDKRDYAEDAIGVVLQMYNVPESMTVSITPVLDEVEKIIEAAQHSAHLTAYRLVLAVSVFINVSFLAVILYLIGGR